MIEWISSYLINSGPIIAATLGLLITWLSLPVIISISYQKRLVDKPTGIRKIHSNVTPNLGGVAFYFALALIFLSSGYAQQSWMPYLFAGLTLLLYSGIKDDILVLSAFKKLIFQISAVAALIFGGDILITDLGGVFGIHEIPHWAGILLTGFTMIVVLNSYNLIDGIDGLAGSVGVISCLFFGIWFWSVGYIPYTILAFTCAGSLLGFLWFNFHPASIFMGDTGSQIIGYMLAFFAVSFVKIGVTAPGYVPFQNAIPILVLSVLIIPLYDTLRVFGLRILKKGSPFKPDRLHVHHQFLDMGFSDKMVCYIIVALNIAIISLTLLLEAINVNILLAVILGSSAVLFPTMGLKRSFFQKLGVQLPSARRIRIFEHKYGFNTGRVKIQPSEESSEREKDWDKVAV